MTAPKDTPGTDRNTGMHDVMAAMKSGDLGEATRRIQAMLGNHHQASPAAQPEFTGASVDYANTAPDGDVLDLVPEWVKVDGRTAKPSADDFVLRYFECQHGVLHYRLHRPGSLKAGAPLLVMLHGCTQDSADFARGTRMNALAEKAGFAVLWPEQGAAANPRRCWRWFEAAHQGPESGEPAALLALFAATAKAHGLDERQFHVAGLSAGGAMAAVLADSNDPRIAAIAVHSGLAAASASNMVGGMGAMRQPGAAKRRPGRRVPTLILHGTADHVVVPGNADVLFEQAVKQEGEPLATHIETLKTGTRTTARDATGQRMVERHLINGLGHAWAGGDPGGSYTSPHGPDASRLIVEFFSEHAAARADG